VTSVVPDNAEQRFAERFARAWSRPTPDGLVTLLHDDVQLYQPHCAPIRGKAAARAEFTCLLKNLPGLHGVVDRACGHDGQLFIEWRMLLPGQRPASIGMVDRFLLLEDLALERRVYFDQLAFLLMVIRHPRRWAGFLRYRLGR
jgi:hypothetical protein